MSVQPALLSLDLDLRQEEKVTTATQTITSAAYVDLTGLTVPIDANRNYWFKALIFFITSAATEGMAFSVNGPSAPTSLRYQVKMLTSLTAFAVRTPTTYDDSAAAGTGPGATVWTAEIEGLIVNGANAGTLALRGRSETGGANTTTVQIGSSFIVREVPR